MDQTILGSLVMGGLLTAFLVGVWWLLIMPLPRGRRVAVRRVDAAEGRVAAVAIVIYGVLGTAGVWDASWHMRYGIAGTTEDFWSPPHLLMYASFGALAVVAGLAALGVLSGDGGVRERLRARPLISVFALLSLYQFLSGPSDEVWHTAYGRDLTAWAVPHFVLLGTAVSALATLVSIRAALPIRAFADRALIVVPLAVIAWTSLGIGVGDWEFTLWADAVPAGNPLLERPPWLYLLAAAIPGALTLGAAIPLAGGRWISVAIAATTIVWSTVGFAVFAALGSSMPLLTTPLGYLAGAVAVDLFRRTKRATPLATGLVFGSACAAVVLASTVFFSRIVDLTTAEIAFGVLGMPTIGAVAYAAGHAIGTFLRTFPDRVAIERMPQVAEVSARSV